VEKEKNEKKQKKKSEKKAEIQMRIIKVWIAAFTLMFIFTIAWYVSLPTVLGMATGLEGSITNPAATNVVAAIKYACYVWGPILDIFLVLWAIISSQTRDVESEIYG